MRLTKAQSQFMAIGGTFPNYQKVMERYGAICKKEYPDVIRRAAQQANYRCSWTPAKGGVKRANITQDKYLSDKANPAKWNKTKYTKTGKKRVGSGQNPKAKKMWFALAAKQGGKKGKDLSRIKVSPSDPKKSRVSQTVKGVKDSKKYLTKAAATIRNKRRMRSGAIAAGFIASAKRAGLTRKGQKNIQPIPGGTASKSVYNAATENDLKAFTVNKVAGSFNVGRRTMIKAVVDTMDDMLDYAQEKLNKQILKAAQQSRGGK